MVLELAKGKLPVFVFILSLYLHIFISCGRVMLKDYAEISRMLQKAHPKNPCTAAAEVQWDLNSGEHFTWVQQLSSPCHAFAQNCSRLQRDICSFQSHIRKFASFYLLSLFFLQDLFQKRKKVLLHCFYYVLSVVTTVIIPWHIVSFTQVFSRSMKEGLAEEKGLKKL